MNERIRQLAEKAGITEYPAKLSVCKEDDGTISTKYEYPLEKFAELIVKECASKADSILRMNQVEYIATGGGTMGDVILEHFGVDE